MISLSRNLSKNTFRLVLNFLGKKVVSLALFSIALGLLIFVVELVMATSIQIFLSRLGLISYQNNLGSLGSLLPTSTTGAIFLLLSVTTCRSLCLWMQSYSNSIVTVEFETLNRLRIVSSALNNRDSRISEISSLFNDKTIGAGSFVSSFIGGFSRLIVMALLVVALLKLAPEVTIFSFVILLAIFIPGRLISKKILSISNVIHLELDGAIAKTLNGVKNLLFLHIHGLNKKEIDRVDLNLRHYLSQYKQYHFFVGMKHAIPQIFGVWLLCGIIFIGKDFEFLDQAVAIQFFYLFIRFVQNAGEVSNLASYLHLTKPRFLAIWNWWNKSRLTNKHFVEPTPPEGSLSEPFGWIFDHVSFGYPGGAQILKDISFQVNFGEALVITGPSGAGKSTLLSLMLGMTLPKSGQVYIQDSLQSYPIKEVRSHLLKMVGYVGPESFVIAGSFRENILYGCERPCSDDELKAAIYDSGCAFIYESPQGLDHQITEQGEGLSAGQKQRLGLARALLRQPKVLILDEATANLDKQTEIALVDTLAKLKSNMTIVAVTHREELLRIADKHLVMPFKE